MRVLGGKVDKHSVNLRLKLERVEKCHICLFFCFCPWSSRMVSMRIIQYKLGLMIGENKINDMLWIYVEKSEN